MGKAPAVIIIARHGARLDAEDATWHTTSSAPYDTPLSYGGWTQTRALGARIASLLHARDLSSAEESKTRRTSDDNGNLGASCAPKRKRRRVVIHTSPFLRCVQSSIAVSAGMAQYTGNLHKFEISNESRPSPSTRFTPRLSAAQSRAQTLDPGAFEARYGNLSIATAALPELPRPKTRASIDTTLAAHTTEPTLRVDAFLGEWLSPEYFEFITAPPSSNMMVAGAKAELLKSAEPVLGAKLDAEEDHQPRSWQGWGEFTSPTTESPSTLSSIKDLSKTLPSLDETPTPPSSKSTLFGYTPPTPLYALSPSQPIPRGFVSHARDACIKIDFKWDSMRDPQNWGDGGEHGEEWSAMHNRFRQGIRQMIDWYKTQDSHYDPQSNSSLDTKDDSNKEQEQDEEEEVVLILLTHGAGCNALIGALTNQPVLMDVGMASLTMAVRRNRFDSATSFAPFRGSSTTPTSPTGRRRASSIDVGLSQEYDMKLIASSEHLRAGADPLKIPQLQTHNLATISERIRQDTMSASGLSTPTELGRQKNSSLGSIRRSTVNSRSSRSYTGMSGRSASPAPSLNGAGLWTDRHRSSTAVTEEDNDPPSPKSETTPSASLVSVATSENASTWTAAGTDEAANSSSESAKPPPAGTWQPPSRRSTSGMSSFGVGQGQGRTSAAALHHHSAGGLWGGTARAATFGSSAVTSSTSSRSRAYTTNEKL